MIFFRIFVKTITSCAPTGVVPETHRDARRMERCDHFSPGTQKTSARLLAFFFTRVEYNFLQYFTTHHRLERADYLLAACGIKLAAFEYQISNQNKSIRSKKI